jgi:hypothetical protein
MMKNIASAGEVRRVEQKKRAAKHIANDNPNPNHLKSHVAPLAMPHFAEPEYVVG